MNHYEIIDHTADIGVRVWAADLGDLFVKAAQAMFDLIAQRHFIPARAKKRRVRIHVKIKSEERTELLVAWLSELLSASGSRGLIFTDFSIQSLNPTSLTAYVSGYSFDHFDLQREIKAVTYHQLKIEEQNGTFEAQVIFDV